MEHTEATEPMQASQASVSATRRRDFFEARESAQSTPATSTFDAGLVTWALNHATSEDTAARISGQDISSQRAATSQSGAVLEVMSKGRTRRGVLASAAAALLAAMGL